jgi:hypothetical protein
MNRTKVAKELVRIARSIEADDSWENALKNAPKFEGMKFKSPSVGGKDIFLIGVEDKFGKAMLQVMNPNRGGTYFEIKNDAEFRQLKIAFASVIDDVEKAWNEFKKNEREYFQKAIDEHNKGNSKANQ